MLVVMGLSYGGVADVLAAMGWAGSKSSIYRDVQAAGEGVERIHQRQTGRRIRVVSANATYVTCRGQEVTVAVALDALAGDVLEVELVDGESADALRPLLTRLQADSALRPSSPMTRTATNCSVMNWPWRTASDAPTSIATWPNLSAN